MQVFGNNINVRLVLVRGIYGNDLIVPSQRGLLGIAAQIRMEVLKKAGSALPT